MKSLRQALTSLWLPAVLLAGWWLASEGSTSPYFPPLREILITFVDTWFFDRFLSDFVPSMTRYAAGVALAMIVGIGGGLALGLSEVLRRALTPLLDFLRSLPKSALIPVLIFALGVGAETQVFIIFLGGLFPILLNTIDGVRAVDQQLLDVARTYRVRPVQQITRIILPSASPQIFVGARLSLSVSLVLMVVSEMLASTNGLGYFVLLSQQTFAIKEMWAGIIMLGLIGYIINTAFMAGESRLLAWHRGWRANLQES